MIHKKYLKLLCYATARTVRTWRMAKMMHKKYLKLLWYAHRTHLEDAQNDAQKVLETTMLVTARTVCTWRTAEMMHKSTRNYSAMLPHVPYALGGCLK